MVCFAFYVYVLLAMSIPPLRVCSTIVNDITVTTRNHQTKGVSDTARQTALEPGTSAWMGGYWAVGEGSVPGLGGYDLSFQKIFRNFGTEG